MIPYIAGIIYDLKNTKTLIWINSQRKSIEINERPLDKSCNGVLTTI